MVIYQETDSFGFLWNTDDANLQLPEILIAIHNSILQERTEELQDYSQDSYQEHFL